MFSNTPSIERAIAILRKGPTCILPPALPVPAVNLEASLLARYPEQMRASKTRTIEARGYAARARAYSPIW